MSTHEQRQDLKDKLFFEKKLNRKVTALNNKIVKQQVIAFNSNNLLSSELFRQDLEVILNNHYDDVGSVFSKRMIPDLPKDIPISSEELGTIAAALTLFFLARSGDQSTIISKTNQLDIDDAIKETQLIADEAAQAGKPLSKREQATTSGAILNRKLKGRSEGISITETNTIAEISKATEIEVLIGRDPSVLVGSSRPSKVDKEWTSVGDGKVRPAHVLADGQVVKFNEPFSVGGESMMYPGSMAMGASLGNIIHCRCGSFTSKTDVYAERRESQELLSSLQDQI